MPCKKLLVGFILDRLFFYPLIQVGSHIFLSFNLGKDSMCKDGASIFCYYGTELLGLSWRENMDTEANVDVQKAALAPFSLSGDFTSRQPPLVFLPLCRRLHS